MTTFSSNSSSQLPAAAPQSANGPHIRIANENGPRELIMIVDDEDFVTLLAERVLIEEGYRVITARDGFQALEIYKKMQDQVHLVILDFVMPVMNGGAVFNELRRINPRAAVVLSSGFGTPEPLNWMLANGLRGFIPKPHSKKKMVLQVRAALDAARGEGEN